MLLVEDDMGKLHGTGTWVGPVGYRELHSEDGLYVMECGWEW